MKIGEKYAARAATNEDNMVPLINVVFLMLVFFMVAGQIKKADPVAVMPPQSINDNRAATDPDVMIVMGMDGSLYLNDQATAMADIQADLEGKVSVSSHPDSFWVQVKADGALPLEKLRPVFNQIRLAGLTKVSLATQLERSQK